MAKKSNWMGAERYGVGQLAGCLHEKLNHVVSLVGASEALLDWLDKGDDKQKQAAAIFRDTINTAKKNLLSDLD